MHFIDKDHVSNRRTLIILDMVTHSPSCKPLWEQSQSTYNRVYFNYISSSVFIRNFLISSKNKVDWYHFQKVMFCVHTHHINHTCAHAVSYTTRQHLINQKGCVVIRNKIFSKSRLNMYTGWFRRKGEYFGRGQYHSLWKTKFIQTCV